MVFGALLLVGVMGGLLADRAKWLPTISGFMLVGLFMGPEGIGLIDKNMLAQAGDLVQVALGLILYKLGSAIKPIYIMQHPKLLLVSVIESVITFTVSGFGPLPQSVWLSTMHATSMNPTEVST